VYNRFLIPFNDEPESSNYEEWIEEEYNLDKKFRYKIGAKVIVTYFVFDGFNIKGMKGVIEETVIYDDKDYNVRFYDVWGDSETWYVPEVAIRILEDEPETSNFEEWVEESINPSRVKHNDYLICVNNEYDSSLKIGEKYKIIQIWEQLPENPGVFRILLNINNRGKSFDVDSSYANQFKIIDEPETSNYEEWIEESKQEFNIGDRVTHKNFPKLYYGIIMGILDNNYNVQWYNTSNDRELNKIWLPKSILVYDRKNNFETSNFEKWIEESHINKFDKWVQ
jgi:hypothetical protein